MGGGGAGLLEPGGRARWGQIGWYGPYGRTFIKTYRVRACAK